MCSNQPLVPSVWEGLRWYIWVSCWNLALRARTLLIEFGHGHQTCSHSHLTNIALATYCNSGAFDVTAGVLSLQHSLRQNRTVRRMLREKLEAAQAGKVQAEKEQGRAATLAATYHHDLELLKREVTGRICTTDLHH